MHQEGSKSASEIELVEAEEGNNRNVGAKGLCRPCASRRMHQKAYRGQCCIVRGREEAMESRRSTVAAREGRRRGCKRSCAKDFSLLSFRLLHLKGVLKASERVEKVVEVSVRAKKSCQGAMCASTIALTTPLIFKFRVSRTVRGIACPVCDDRVQS